MQVRMTQSVTGGHGRFLVGDTADLPSEVAAAWIAAEIAVAIEDPQRVEAAQPAAETAAIEPPSYAAFTRQSKARKR